MSARNAENKGPTALAIVVCVSVLSTVFTAARLFTRGKVLGKISLDDYFIVASVVSSTSFIGTVLFMPTTTIPIIPIHSVVSLFIPPIFLRQDAAMEVEF